MKLSGLNNEPICTEKWIKSPLLEQTYQVTLSKEHAQLLEPFHTCFASKKIKYYDVSKDGMGQYNTIKIFFIYCNLT